jgi:hypothetical protein
MTDDARGFVQSRDVPGIRTTVLQNLRVSIQWLSARQWCRIVAIAEEIPLKLQVSDVTDTTLGCPVRQQLAVR